MAITIPVNDIAATPAINMEEFRMRVTDYATKLWNQMLSAEVAKASHANIKHHTSARISRLGLQGGQAVPADIDESEALYLEKYA